MRNKKVAILHYLPLSRVREEVIKKGYTLEVPLLCVEHLLERFTIWVSNPKYHPSISSHILHDYF